jgi:4-alpha-glucanotransferase
MYLPHTFTADKVVYTGTHDNDTLVGWWQTGASEQERKYAKSYLGESEDGIHWAMIRAAVGSVASISVVPMQDVLGLGSEARMNVPSSNNGNWQWRYKPGVSPVRHWRKLAVLSKFMTASLSHCHHALLKILLREFSAHRLLLAPPNVGSSC